MMPRSTSPGAAGAAVLAAVASDALFRRAFKHALRQPVSVARRRRRALPQKLKMIRGERLLWWP